MTDATLFALDEASSIPLWLQLKKRFVYLISSGHYAPGDQLPTVRGLAASININYNTVSKVYRSLEEDGYIESRRRQGAFVLDVGAKANAREGINQAVERLTREYIEHCKELGMDLDAAQAEFRQALQREKAKQARKRGGADVRTQAPGCGSAPSSGRITVFPGAQDSEQRSARNGA